MAKHGGYKNIVVLVHSPEIDENQEHIVTKNAILFDEIPFFEHPKHHFYKFVYFAQYFEKFWDFEGIRIAVHFLQPRWKEHTMARKVDQLFDILDIQFGNLQLHPDIVRVFIVYISDTGY